MAIDVRMPKLSDNMEEGVIIRWMKAPGDSVAQGEPLAEVETDKADVELEATDAGILQTIKVPEGQSAAVGAVIAVLSAPGETAGDADGDGASAGGQSDEAPAPPQKRGAAAGSSAETRPARSTTERGRGGGSGAPRGAAVEQSGAPGRTPERSKSDAPAVAPRNRPAAPSAAAPERPVRASPLAWRMAEAAGVNLDTVSGSGPGGRILQRDVEAAVRGGPTDVAQPGGWAERPERATERPASPTVQGGAAHTLEPSRMRLAIAKRMAEAKRDIPHFYVTAEIDMSEAMRLRESIKRSDTMPGLTVTHLLLRALTIALTRHPRVNGSWRDQTIELHDDVNLGIAVAVDDGLVVPVLHRAQTLTLGEIAVRAAELTDKARAGKFSGPELTGGTFSLSNVGMLDIEELVAVINPPQAAILAVGAVKDRPVVRGGQLAVAKTMRATLSCDHRVLNGVEAGRFLEELKAILENPVVLLLE